MPFTTKINLRRLIAFVTIGVTVDVFISTALTFVPLLVVDKFHGAERSGAAVLPLGHIPGLAAGPLGRHVSDRIGKVPVMLSVGLLPGPIVYLLGLGTHWWLLPLVLLAMGICVYVAMPVTEAYEYFHAKPLHCSRCLLFCQPRRARYFPAYRRRLD